MRQAIFTKWLQPTDTQSSRVKAYGKDKRQCVIDPWDWGSSAEQNHCRVAKLLAAKLDWSGLYVGGFFDNGGFCYVNIPVENFESLNFRNFGRQDIDWFWQPKRKG